MGGQRQTDLQGERVQRASEDTDRQTDLLGERVQRESEDTDRQTDLLGETVQRGREGEQRPTDRPTGRESTDMERGRTERDMK